MSDSDLIELLLHLDGRNREIGCKAAARIRELEGERDAIEAATINQILQIIPGGDICDPQVIADRIRALLPTSAQSTLPLFVARQTERPAD